MFPNNLISSSIHCALTLSARLPRGFVELVPKMYARKSKHKNNHDPLLCHVDYMAGLVPVFAPVHVALVQIAEQLESVVTFRRRLEGTLPHSHGGDLVVLLVKTQAALDLEWDVRGIVTYSRTHFESDY